MKCKVTLYDAGTVFEEIVIASDYQQAQQKAMARNPGSTHVSTTAIFDKPDHSGFNSDRGSSSGGGSAFSSDSGEGLGLLAGLAVIGTVGWLAWEAWKFASAIVIGVWQWFVGLFSWIPFMSPQLLVFLVLGFFFFILILGALDD
jgi:hypothetical protein